MTSLKRFDGAKASGQGTDLAAKKEAIFEEAVDHFFEKSAEVCARGRPMRFHVSKSPSAIYGRIIARDYKDYPTARYLVMVPNPEDLEVVEQELQAFDGFSVYCASSGTPLQPGVGVVILCAYAHVGCVQDWPLRIRVVEEPLAGDPKEEDHRAALKELAVMAPAELAVNFGRAMGKLSARPARPRNRPSHIAGNSASASLWDIGVGLLTSPNSLLWKAFIRPPRQTYEDQELGARVFIHQERFYERRDVTLQSSQGHPLKCSHFVQRGIECDRCVVYLHGNCSSRLEVMTVLPALLELGMSVFSFDFAGCGSSGGEYISLGFHEEQDLGVVCRHLRSEGVSAVALWGRSMGAVAATLRASQDADIAACVLDSPFADLALVVDDYISKLSLVSGLILRACVSGVSEEIKSRAGFALDELAPVRTAGKGRCPVIFALAVDDTFILPHHTLSLHNAWGGERHLHHFDGGHGGSRPPWFISTAARFLADHLEERLKAGAPALASGSAAARRAYAL